jgi:glycosyltransferase involved in cell wall biosynthesis
MVKLSIVTCTRNSMATLSDTVDSMQRQSYRNFEHIFVDGDSTDGTLDYLAERCPQAMILKNVTGGIARAMNSGLAAATGDVVAYLHSDDFYAHSGVLAKVAARFADDRCEWLVGRTDTLKGDSIIPCPELGSFSRWKFRSRNFYFPHPSTFMRTALMRSLGGFDETIRYAMDIEFWLRAIRVAEPVVIDDTLAVFRNHEGSLSSANRCATIRDEWAVRRKHVKDDLLAAPLMHCRMLKHVLMAGRVDRS